jgi:hypothetical protein
MLNDSQKKISRDFLLSLQKRETDTIHFLDGYEQLSLLGKLQLRLKLIRKFGLRFNLKSRSRNCRNSSGFIFTAHSPALRIPIIYRTFSNLEIFRRLVRNMINDANFKIDDNHIDQIFKESNANFRNGFFKLYDLFEEINN